MSCVETALECGQSSLRIPLILRPSVLPACQSVVLSVD